MEYQEILKKGIQIGVQFVIERFAQSVEPDCDDYSITLIKYIADKCFEKHMKESKD